jgi:hypothetical protein
MFILIFIQYVQGVAAFESGVQTLLMYDKGTFNSVFKDILAAAQKYLVGPFWDIH